MAYSGFDWKFVIGILAGFVVGLFYATMLSPWVFGNQFLVPFMVAFIVGFSWWFSRLPTLKMTLLAVCGAVAVFFLLRVFMRQSEDARIRSTMRELREQVSSPSVMPVTVGKGGLRETARCPSERPAAGGTLGSNPVAPPGLFFEITYGDKI